MLQATKELTVVQFDNLHATEDLIDKMDTAVHGLHLANTAVYEVAGEFCMYGQHHDDGDEANKN
jgi:hypothetical protein